MGLAKMPGAGGIKVTNGKLVEYISQTEEIQPNTFVQASSWTSQILGASQTHAFDIDWCECTPISDGKVLLTYSSGAYLYHRVATVNGTTVSLGTAVTHSISQASGYISVELLSSGKYLVSCRRYQSGGYQYLVYVLTVSGNTVSLGSVCTVFSSGERLVYGCTAVRSSTSAIVIGKTSIASTNTVYFLTISGTSVTVNSTTATISTVNVFYAAAVAIDSSKVLALRIGDTTSTVQSVYAEVLSISGTTVSITTSSKSDSSYGNIYNTRQGRLLKLSNTRYLAVWRYDGDAWRIAPVKVSGTTPTLGTSYHDSWDRNASDMIEQPPGFAIISASKVVQIRTENTLRYAVYNVSDSAVSVAESATTLSNTANYTSGGAVVSGEKVVAFYDVSSDATACYSIVFSPKTNHSGVKPSAGTILGLTQTKVTPSKAGKVWVYSAT